MIKTCLIALMIACFALPVRASSVTSNESTSLNDPRSSLSTIFFTGVGGAVFGLSTLSFYGRPQEHMPNIAIGFAIGIIFGAGYVTVEAAHRPASTAANYIPASETEMVMNSGHATHSVASNMTPAQWNWSF